MRSATSTWISYCSQQNETQARKHLEDGADKTLEPKFITNNAKHRCVKVRTGHVVGFKIGSPLCQNKSYLCIDLNAKAKAESLVDSGRIFITTNSVRDMVIGQDFCQSARITLHGQEAGTMRSTNTNLPHHTTFTLSFPRHQNARSKLAEARTLKNLLDGT